MKKKPIAFISTEPSEAPFQENPDEQPEQGESQDSKEIEDSDPKKCTVYPILFSKLSVIGKIEWTMMIATQAIEPFIQELLQPPEVFLKS